MLKLIPIRRLTVSVFVISLGLRLTAPLSHAAGATANPVAATEWTYPATKTVDAVDVHFGRSYPDPFRWLEDRKDPGVEAWFKAQAALTDSVIDRIPGRDRLVEEWLALDRLRAAAYSDIQVQAGRVFYKKTLGGENVGRLYVREGWTGKERLLFDPSGYAPGVTSTIEFFSPSPDGRHVALGLSSSGAEWAELRVFEVGSGAFLSERYYPTRGVPTWTPDGAAFFFGSGDVKDIRDKAIQLNRRVRLHRLGGDFADATDVFSIHANAALGIEAKEIPRVTVPDVRPDIRIGALNTVARERRLFIASGVASTETRISWRELCRRSDRVIMGPLFFGEHVYAVTSTGASRFKVVRTSLESPDWATAETVVPEAADTITGFVQTRDHALITYSNGIVGRLLRLEFATGRVSSVELPLSGIVTVEVPNFAEGKTFIAITAWTRPRTLFDYEPQSGQVVKSVFDTAIEYPGFESLVSETVEVPGHDGTPVPLSLLYRRGLKRDGSAVCILRGYGAYGISMTPAFNIQHSPALREGVVLAVAHVRGGGEKGDDWRRGGWKETKPNTWKDFISCAEYLVREGYTRPERLTGTGTSAGGVMITRAITERPDLFAAAVCNVGTANTLRREFAPNGAVNIPEYGTVEIEVEALGLAEMDGVRHVRDGVAYPAVLGVAGWNDARVPPWQPGKFIAAVQTRSASAKPALLKVNYDNGHFTEDKQVAFANFASQFAFLLWQAGHPDFQPRP